MVRASGSLPQCGGSKIPSDHDLQCYDLYRSGTADCITGSHVSADGGNAIIRTALFYHTYHGGRADDLLFAGEQERNRIRKRKRCGSNLQRFVMIGIFTSKKKSQCHKYK